MYIYPNPAKTVESLLPFRAYPFIECSCKTINLHHSSPANLRLSGPSMDETNSADGDHDALREGSRAEIEARNEMLPMRV